MDDKKTQKFRQRLLEEYQKLIRSINRNRLAEEEIKLENTEDEGDLATISHNKELLYNLHVNDELKSLEAFLDASMGVVRSSGRVVVITFHSLEDRIVKHKFRNSAISGRVLTKKVVTATPDEVQRNPRARSAKLRAWERS